MSSMLVQLLLTPVTPLDVRYYLEHPSERAYLYGEKKKRVRVLSEAEKAKQGEYQRKWRMKHREKLRIASYERYQKLKAAKQLGAQKK